MSKIHLLTTIAKLATKNIGLAVGDSLTFGMVGAVKDTALEIVESTTATNEALYYMQVRTFLETANLNEEEVTDFFKNNTDHQRLGVEIF
ncbi:MAG TPA: hypothetical protein DHW80_12545, partial [Acinetobacter sp.]|nr:hypothetical protein [Acinetobacter sp.]